MLPPLAGGDASSLLANFIVAKQEPSPGVSTQDGLRLTAKGCSQHQQECMPVY
jgi:hypothetical protein